MTDFKYRSDVDGLRAVAVLLVLLFHVGLGFPGGYVGVDVFFVISGFLITGLILKEQQARRFRLSGFWSRRIRRIIPAATLVVLVTALAGAVILIPRDFEDLAKSTLAQQLMLSNVYFWRDIGYFKGPAELKPLLHTWSLAVEEQFYLGYPFLLVLLGRFSRIVIVSSLALIAVASFALSEWGVRNSPSAAFYLLPTRAWELLLGALICFLPVPALLKSWQANMLGGLGIFGILFSALWFDATTPFPGMSALLPCVGATLLIYANSHQITWTGRLLSQRPVVFIGLISYSLYLWHWPLLAYCKYLLPNKSLPMTWGVLILLASFGLAYVSWRFVELPFRRRQERMQLRRSFLLIGGGVLATMIGSLIVYLSGGLPGRFSPEVLAAIEDATWSGRSIVAGGVRFSDGGLARVGDATNGDRPRVLVWGDSHTMMCAEAIERAAVAAKLDVMVGSTAGTPPAPGLWRGRDPSSRSTCEEVNEQILRAALRPDITDVILIARWSAYVEGYSDADLAHEERDNQWDGFLVVDDQSDGVSKEEALGALERRLTKLASELQQAGKNVWILKQVPEVNQPIAVYLLRSMRFEVPLRIDTVTRDDHLERQKRVDALFDQLKNQGVRVIDVSDRFFDSQRNVVPILDGRAVYKDNDHLSRSGAKRMLDGVFDNIFQKLTK